MQVERELEALGFLGVDGVADAARGREARQLAQPGEQLTHDTRALCFLEARMEGRELDGDRVRCAHRADGVRVKLHVALRIGRGAGGFAEHVVGMHIGRALGAAAHGVVDGFGEHELLGKNAHRLAHRGAHHRLAKARDDVLEWRGLVVPARELAREEQGPVGGAREQRVVAARRPVALRELIAQQRIGGRRVGDAQQRLGDAHERDAFGRGEPVVAQKRFGAERSGRRGAHALGEAQRSALDLAAAGGLPRAQTLDDVGFRHAVVAAHFGQCGDERLGQYNHRPES